MKVAIIGKGSARKEIATGSSGKLEVKSRHLIPGRRIAEDEKQEDVMEVAVTYVSPIGAIKELTSFACWKPVSGATVAVKVDYELENCCSNSCYSPVLQYF